MTKVLIIEDETALRENICEMLSLEGFDVYSAEDGRRGIDTAFSIHPDLIVCDIAMPEMDGYQVLEMLRKNEETMGTPFIFLTARVDRGDMRQGMQLGADDYITKPFSHQELAAAVRSRLARKQQLDEVGQKDLERAKRELTQMVSHELRTPLVSISMVQEYISSQLDQLSREELGDLLGILRNGSQRLNHLVEQMVMFTQVQAGMLNEQKIRSIGQPSDIWSIMIAGINLGRRFAYRRPNGAIETNEMMPQALVQCHSPALSHALGEIIANALDFSGDDQPLTFYQWVEEGLVWLQVVDHGPGIPQDRLHDAFKPFVQINRNQQEQQGMGLGLALAQMVIQAHGGAIYLESTPLGTRVSISLPLIG